jgi:hypothetical protein
MGVACGERPTLWAIRGAPVGGIFYSLFQRWQAGEPSLLVCLILKAGMAIVTIVQVNVLGIVSTGFRDGLIGS